MPIQVVLEDGLLDSRSLTHEDQNRAHRKMVQAI